MDSTDSFDRPSVLWSIGTRNIGNFVKDVYTDTKGENMEYTTAVEVGDIYSGLSSLLSQGNDDNYEYGIYVDGIEYSIWAAAHGHAVPVAPTTTHAGFVDVINNTTTGKYVPSGNGALTQVFVIDDRTYPNGESYAKDQIVISTINSHLAVVDYVEETNDGDGYITYVTLKEASLDDGLDYKKIQTSVVISEEFEKGDVVTLTAEGSYSTGMQIITIDAVSTETGIMTQVKNDEWIELDNDEDNRYHYNIATRGNVDVYGQMNPLDLNCELELYLDQYGYVLGFDIIEAAQNYFYVEGRDGDGWSSLDGKGVTVKVTNTKGEEQNITVTHIDGKAISSYNYDIIPAVTRIMDGDNNIGAANENFQVDLNNYYVDEGNFENRIFGYVYNSTTDTYDLKTDSAALLDLDEYGRLANQNDADRDTTGIFTSVRYADGTQYDTRNYGVEGVTQVNNSEFKYDDTILLTGQKWNGTDDYENIKVAYSEKTDAGESQEVNYTIGSNRNVYALEKNAGGIIAMTATPDIEDEATIKNVYDYDATSAKRRETIDHTTEFAVTNGDSLSEATSNDYAFRIDAETVFVDVVTGQNWVGRSTDVEIKGGDMNMQVLFGSGGAADVVFINHGINQDTSDKAGYFITDNVKGTQKTIDGMAVWTYDVYIAGVQSELVADYDLEAADNLQVNTLYRVDQWNSNGYVSDITALICYDDITNVAIGATSLETDLQVGATLSPVEYSYTTAAGSTLLHSGWSVASQASAENLYLKWAVGYNEGNSGEAGYENTVGTNNYAYNDSTTFVQVKYDALGKISSVKPASASDINTWNAGSSNGNVSWVDVVSVDGGSTNSPYATLVMILQPNDTDDSTGGEVDSGYGGLAAYENQKMYFVTSESGSKNGLDKSNAIVIQGMLNLGINDPEQTGDLLPGGSNKSRYIAMAAVEDFIRDVEKGELISWVSVEEGDVYYEGRDASWVFEVTMKSSGGSVYTRFFSIELSDSTEESTPGNSASGTEASGDFTVGIPAGTNLYAALGGSDARLAEFFSVYDADGEAVNLHTVTNASGNTNLDNWLYDTTVSSIWASGTSGTMLVNHDIFGDKTAVSGHKFMVKYPSGETVVYDVAEFGKLTLGGLRGATISCSVLGLSISDNVKKEVEEDYGMTLNSIVTNSAWTVFEGDANAEEGDKFLVDFAGSDDDTTYFFARGTSGDEPELTVSIDTEGNFANAIDGSAGATVTFVAADSGSGTASPEKTVLGNTLGGTPITGVFTVSASDPAQDSYEGRLSVKYVPTTDVQAISVGFADVEKPLANEDIVFTLNGESKNVPAGTLLSTVVKDLGYSDGGVFVNYVAGTVASAESVSNISWAKFETDDGETHADSVLYAGDTLQVGYRLGTSNLLGTLGLPGIFAVNGTTTTVPTASIVEVTDKLVNSEGEYYLLDGNANITVEIDFTGLNYAGYNETSASESELEFVLFAGKLPTFTFSGTTVSEGSGGLLEPTDGRGVVTLKIDKATELTTDASVDLVISAGYDLSDLIVEESNDLKSSGILSLGSNAVMAVKDIDNS